MRSFASAPARDSHCLPTLMQANKRFGGIDESEDQVSELVRICARSGFSLAFLAGELLQLQLHHFLQAMLYVILTAHHFLQVQGRATGSSKNITDYDAKQLQQCAGHSVSLEVDHLGCHQLRAGQKSFTCRGFGCKKKLLSTSGEVMVPCWFTLYHSQC